MKKIFFILFLILIFNINFLSAATRVMPLGDSITYDDSYADYDGHSRPASIRHAYRNYLYYKLRDAKYAVDFVGSRIAGTAVVPHFDPENEGYPGETSDFIGNHIYGFLARNPADIILLHIGTNDRWAIDSSGNYMSGIEKIFNEVDRFERNYHYHVKIILALIIGRKDHDFSSFTNTFNHNLHNIANIRIAHGDDIFIVDMQHGADLNYHTDFRDPAHPTDSGYNKMANVWYNALKRFLPTPTKPTAPTHFIVSSIDTHAAVFHWDDNSNNESGFKIYRGSTLVGVINEGTTVFMDSNLHHNTKYTYKIIAYNSIGDSNPTYLTFRTKNEIPKPPSNLTISHIKSHSALLRWKDNSDNENGFKIYQGSTYIATVGPNVKSYPIKNLSARRTYTYHVVSYNEKGRSTTAHATFSTLDDYAWLPAVYHIVLY